MYVVTNRALRIKEGSLNIGDVQKYPNDKGPNEISLLKVGGASAARASLEALKENPLSKKEVETIKNKYRLDIDTSDQWYSSLAVAGELFDQAQKMGKHVLFYVHGYNNDIKDVLSTAFGLENQYNILVVPFTWPANGGGSVSGKLSYLDDKRDARVSADALSRVIGKFGQYFEMFTKARRNELMERSRSTHPANATAQREYFSSLLERDCKVTLNMLCHSMGNYLLKHALRPSNVEAAKLVFDNIVLAAADANNKDHKEWVEKIQTRNRLYITINENDYALSWSRRKPGNEQLARLGHYLHKLNAGNADYIDVTDVKSVKTSHSYYLGTSVERSAKLRKLFQVILSGGNARHLLEYQSDNNSYILG